MLVSSCESSNSPELKVKSVKASQISNDRRDSDSDRYNKIMIASQEMTKKSKSTEAVAAGVSKPQIIIDHEASAF